MKIFKKIYRNVIVLFKPLTVHTEAIIMDDIWEKIKQKAVTGKVFKWYVMTPANYEYTKVFLNLKISKKQYSEKLKERYLWLLKNNQKLELHVHLNPVMNITCEEQEKIIKEAVEWMEKELRVRPKEFVSGWWKCNKDTLEILKKFNLKLIKSTNYKSCHDYD